jgi:predicted ATPase/DNA-binding CsgD family transcriptional regulator
MTPTNLPVQLTSFIGRERELAEVEGLISTSRLVTLTGAGGCGKTRLAIQVGNNMSGAFADGVWLVDFVPLREPELIPQHVAQTFNLHPSPNQSFHELLLNFARSKQMLLILDNCEHLIAAIAQLVQELLTTSTGLNILATSRQPLNISGEMIYQVLGLALPLSYSVNAFNSQDLLQYDAIHLLVERARAVSTHFIITPENAAAIVEICRRVDGIPLALELTSARLKILTPQQIAARLDNRLALLAYSQRTGHVAHHHALQAAIDWSYDLLTPEEQILLRRLGVFDAGFTLGTVESVCTGDGITKEHTLDLLSSLVDKSLVIAETIGRVEARYGLLESIREYAIGKLKRAGEATRLHDRHLEFFVARAEEIAPKLQDSSYQDLWLNWLDGEQDNLRAALAWSLESGRIENGLHLILTLVWYRRLRLSGSGLEIRTWLEQLLGQADETVPLELRASASNIASTEAALLGDSEGATAHAHAAIAFCEAMGEAGKPMLANALMGLAMASQATGDFATGLAVYERATLLFREQGDMTGLVFSMFGRASGALALGNYKIARSLIEEGLAAGQTLRHPYPLVMMINLLGDLERFEGNYERAQAAYEQCLDVLRQTEDRRDEAGVLHSLAHAHLHQGNLPRAHTFFSESMSMQQVQGNTQGLAECLIGFGAMSIVAGMPAQAARLFAAAVALGGKALLVQWPAERMEYEHYQSMVGAQLSEQELQEAQMRGRILTMEQAIEYALSLPLGRATSAPEPHEEFAQLSEREREIAALIMQGKRNGEIAKQLVLSKRTVEKHVANILSKLGLTSRTQIVRWAIEHNLTSTSL